MTKSSVESDNWTTDPSFKAKSVYLHCETHGDSEPMEEKWAGKAHVDHVNLYSENCVVTMMAVIQMIDEGKE